MRLSLPARSGPGSLDEEAVLEHCHPETYTVSRYLAICVTWTGSSLQSEKGGGTSRGGVSLPGLESAGDCRGTAAKQSSTTVHCYNALPPHISNGDRLEAGSQDFPASRSHSRRTSEGKGLGKAVGEQDDSRSIGVRDLLLASLVLEESVKLLGLSVGRVREFDGAPLADDLLSRVGAHETVEARAL